MPAEISTPSPLLYAPANLPARIYLLADDLTGACDAGAAFLAAGREVRVWLGAKAPFAAPESVQAVNTASRDLPADQAAEAVTRAASDLKAAADAIVFKKVDSAARGHIAAELLAAQRALGAQATLFAPGFPAMGRTVRDGILEVRDASGQNVRIDLRELFAAEMSDSTALIAHATELTAALDAGRTIVICDSATQEDLNALANAAKSIATLLYAGSAGLARALAHTYGSHASAPLPAAARTLLIAGTPHPLTKLQLEQLESSPRLAERVQILRTDCEPGNEATIREIFHAFNPEALILTGGDTALFAGQALGAHSILLKGEFTAGIPWGILQGGEAQGRIVVTKSGGFGLPSALHDLIERFAGEA